MKSLAEMTDEVVKWAIDKGFEPNPNRTFGDEIALLHSEASEALEAFRDFHDFGEHEVEGKPEGVPSEFADVLIRLLHTCYARGIDLEAMYETKMAFNRGRPWRNGGKAI